MLIESIGYSNEIVINAVISRQQPVNFAVFVLIAVGITISSVISAACINCSIFAVNERNNLTAV
jgi:hypothetical protein